MSRSLLVLGGSGFVGRAAVTEALQMGWEVTTFNRGVTGEPDPSAEAVVGDRRDPHALAPLVSRDWDLVIDTWSGASRVVRDSATALRDRTRQYAYISTASVYTPPPPLNVDETAATVTAGPDAEHGDYAESKRGAELAVERLFPGRSLLARAGLILGPHENVGRLTWWLSRMARGGEILAPGPPDMPIQYIDARDLARFVLTASSSGHTGPFNVVSARGHTTTGGLLDACKAVAGADDAELTWVDPETIAAAGIEPWLELPVWLPPQHEYAGMHHANVDRAHRAGLRCRSVSDTVGDTWHWLQSLNGRVPLRADLPTPGLSQERERAALKAWRDGRP